MKIPKHSTLARLTVNTTLLLMCLAPKIFAEEKNIIKTDWLEAPIGHYADGTVVPGAIGKILVKSPANFYVTVVEVNSKKVVQFTNTTGKNDLAGLIGNIHPLSSGKIEGTIKLKALPLQTGNRSPLIIAINAPKANFTSKDHTAVQITLDHDLNLVASTENTLLKTGQKFAAGEVYALHFWADFNDPIQDIYGFSLHDTSGSKLYQSPVLKTRAANITPSLFLILGASVAAASPDSFIEIQEVILSEK